MFRLKFRDYSVVIVYDCLKIKDNLQLLRLSICINRFSHKLGFSNHYIFATQCYMTLHISNYELCWINVRLKYHRLTPSCYKDIGIRQFEFVEKLNSLVLPIESCLLLAGY